ncbi:MAG: transcriptional regulator NrdR [Anaerolineae bacterium]|nr:transcriptional regulator NrdR [Anaerolineae bacterium]
MRCLFCGSDNSKVVDTRHDAQGNVRRRRECTDCDQRFSTLERAILTTPLVAKRDGRREEFDPEKLKSGLRTACARRPVSAAAIERIVDRVEYAIRQTGRTEVASRLIGDIAIEELRKLDEVAYIRYAIVYLGLKDLESIRAEIDQLRAQRR